MIDVKTLEIDEEMLLRANRDIATRSTTGAFIYLLIWFAITISHNFYATAPTIFIFFTSAFALLAIARAALIRNFEKIYRKSVLLWKACFFPSVWGAALLWGVVCYMALVDPRFDAITLSVVISTAGLTAGGVTALLPDRLLTIGLFTAFLLPAELTIFHTEFLDFSVNILFLLYWVGMYSVTRIQHQEYWVGLKHMFLIKKHAQELEQLNTLDGLTGLKNRRFFDEILRKEMKAGVRKQSQLSLMLIDIDYFKEVNDRYGHLAGDECLRKLAILLKEQVQRETDTVARYGGEEFAVILPADGRKQAIVVAEQIRKAVEEIDCRCGEDRVLFTVSIGVASIIPQLGDIQEKLIALADQALYQAKTGGRNQVRGLMD